MNKTLFAFLLLLTSVAFAQQDVCCVFKGTNGDSIQTFARIISSSDCKSGGVYQGKSICTSVADPENTYCSSDSKAQDRCAKCGGFWSGKECLTEDPKEKAKKELKEEEAKKKAGEKQGGQPAETSAPKTGPSSVTTTPIQPSADEDQLYNKRPNNKTKGLDSAQ